MKIVAQISLSLLLCGCSAPGSGYVAAENALDAGREFIAARQKGDFKKAAFYTGRDQENTRLLAMMEKAYLAETAEEKKRDANASCLLDRVTDIQGGGATIQYHFSYDKTPEIITALRQQGLWVVNLTANQTDRHAP
jgi:hypothetical protein